MTIGLLTITHDEPGTLPTMLASVRDIIDGPTIAFHVGEHDDTIEILRDFDTEVHLRQWADFDGSWNELFALAQGRADRFIYAAANEVWTHTDLPDLGDVPSYMIRYTRGPYEFRLPNLLRGDIPWTISAPVHGVIKPDFFEERRSLDELTVLIDDSDGRRPEKISRYLPICERMVAQDPDDSRAVFYLARTYFDVGRYEEAIRMYDRRIIMGGWDEEVWHAHYMKGVAQIKLGRFTDGRLTLLGAYHRRPTRAEPLRALCQSMLPPDDLLFIEPDAYGKPV